MVYCFKVCLDLILRETTYNRGVLAWEVLLGVLGESNHSVQSMCRSGGWGPLFLLGYYHLKTPGHCVGTLKCPLKGQWEDADYLQRMTQ